MSASEWLAPAAACAGAAVGGVLSYLGARAGQRTNRAAVIQQDEAGRREEWGRRFAAALTLLGDDSARDRMIGRALLVALFQSELSTEEDRQTAARILAAEALTPGGAPELHALPSGRSLDDVRFVQDDGVDSIDASGASTYVSGAEEANAGEAESEPGGPDEDRSRNP